MTRDKHMNQTMPNLVKKTWGAGQPGLKFEDYLNAYCTCALRAKQMCVQKKGKDEMERHEDGGT